MNKTTIKLTQFYLAIVGVESVNADRRIEPQIPYTGFLRLEEELNDLFFSLDFECQLTVKFYFDQASILIKKYANFERIMTKEQFFAIAAIIVEED